MSRIYQRGDYWYIDYTYRGKRIRESIGHSKKIADLKLKDIELKIARDEQLGIQETKKVLFRDFAEEYLNYSKANKAPKSYGRDISSLRRNLIPCFGNRYISEINQYEIDQYKIKRLENVTPATVNRELACLKHLYTKAIEWGITAHNPAKKVKNFKEQIGRVKYLTAEQIKDLINNCSDGIRPIVITAVNTGMRRGEILNLKWSDVDLLNRKITILKTKNKEVRIIPINGLLYQELRRMPRNGEYLFSKEDGRPYGDPKRAFKSALKSACIKDFRFHDLRHTFASHLALSGIDIRTIQELLGHKDIRLTMRYSHLSPGHLQEAVNILGTKLAHSVREKKPSYVSYEKSMAPVAQLDRATDF